MRLCKGFRIGPVVRISRFHRDGRGSNPRCGAATLVLRRAVSAPGQTWKEAKKKGALPGIEPGTSPTLRENHTTRPQGQRLSAAFGAGPLLFFFFWPWALLVWVGRVDTQHDAKKKEKATAPSIPI